MLSMRSSSPAVSSISFDEHIGHAGLSPDARSTANVSPHGPAREEHGAPPDAERRILGHRARADEVEVPLHALLVKAAQLADLQINGDHALRAGLLGVLEDDADDALQDGELVHVTTPLAVGCTATCPGR